MNIHTKLDWLDALFSIIMRKDKEETKCTVHIYECSDCLKLIVSCQIENQTDLTF